ncbi:MAG: hypothetical protein AB8D78_01980 [Akkermansiaceae bacterium]
MKSPSTSPTSLFHHSLVFLALFALPLDAKDDIFGTLDIDGDGDGDPVGTNVPFQIDSDIEDGSGNPIYNYLGFATDGTPMEFWATEGSSEQWETYTEFPDVSNDMGARVLKTLTAGESFFYRQSATLGFSEYTMRWRDSNGNLPTGTLLSFGFGFDGEPMNINGGTLQADSNLTKLNNGGNPGNDGPQFSNLAPTGYNGSLGNYRWYNYEVDSQGSNAIFEIKNPTFNGNPSEVGDIIWYFQLPDQVTLDANGETLPEYTPWALSGYNDKGEFVSVTPGDDYYLTAADGLAKVNVQNDDPTNDLVFSWTVDNKTKNSWGGPNDNVIPGLPGGPPLIPEPSVAFMTSLSMLLLAFRRRRD